jgi:beta-lactamase class A
MDSIRKIHNILILLILFCSQLTFAQLESARTKIEEIIKQTKGKVGIAVMDLENKDTLTVNDNYCYPMQSVFKFPLALYVLNQVDKGNLSLEQKIHLSKENLHPKTWSPLREKYKDGDVDVSLDEIIKNTVAWSDNNGCDILFKLAGGTDKVNQYIKSLGIDGISIVANEETMHKDWNVQYKNCSNPFSMSKLLYKFRKDSILSASSTDFLWNIMFSTVTGAERLKGELPEGTKVAHKTGSSGVNDGIAAATNDIGIVTLPNGKQYAIVVFVSDSPDNEKTRDKIIANISKAVWDVDIHN